MPNVSVEPKLQAILEYEHRRKDGTLISRGKKTINFVGTTLVEEIWNDNKGRKKSERITTVDGEVLYQSSGRRLYDFFRRISVKFKVR